MTKEQEKEQEIRDGIVASLEHDVETADTEELKDQAVVAIQAARNAGYVDETQTKALFEKLGRLMPPTTTTTIPASAVAEGKKKKTAKAKGAEGAFTGNAEENGAAPAGRSRETVIIDPREIEDMREWSAEIISLENEKRLTLAKINRLKDELKDLRKTVDNYEGRISELGGKGYRGYKSGRLF